MPVPSSPQSPALPSVVPDFCATPSKYPSQFNFVHIHDFGFSAVENDPPRRLEDVLKSPQRSLNMHSKLRSWINYFVSTYDEVTTKNLEEQRLLLKDLIYHTNEASKRNRGGKLVRTQSSLRGSRQDIMSGIETSVEPTESLRKYLVDKVAKGVGKKLSKGGLVSEILSWTKKKTPNIIEDRSLKNTSTEFSKHIKNYTGDSNIKKIPAEESLKTILSQKIELISSVLINIFGNS